MGDKLKVAQLAERYGLRPQVINGYVKNYGLVCAGDKPRMIDTDVFDAFLAEFDKKKKVRKEVRQTIRAERGGQDGPVGSAVLEAFKMQNKMMAWNREGGRGWALAKGIDDESYPEDDFLILQNHLGQKTPATESKLLEEAKQGKLFFITPDEALHFVAQQLHQITQDEEREGTEVVASALDHLRAAYKDLITYREAYMIKNEKPADEMLRRMRSVTMTVSKDEIDRLVEKQLSA